MSREEPGLWNPYLAGGLAGALAVLSAWATGKFFGASTTFVRAAGLIEKIFVPQRVASLEYFIKETPRVDWQWMFVTGVLVGSCISAVWSRSFAWRAVPETWKTRFGSSLAGRWGVAFLGGVIAIMGARLADGCPSGHGLSGVMQLAVSGLIALVCFFIGGAAVVRLLYKTGRPR